MFINYLFFCSFLAKEKRKAVPHLILLFIIFDSLIAYIPFAGASAIIKLIQNLCLCPAFRCKLFAKPSIEIYYKISRILLSTT